MIGFFYGVGVYNKISHSINFLIALGITLISYVFMIYLWAGIFGMDLSVDFVWISRLIPFLDFQAFVFCLHFLSLLFKPYAFICYDFCYVFGEDSYEEVGKFKKYMWFKTDRRRQLADCRFLLFWSKCDRIFYMVIRDPNSIFYRSRGLGFFRDSLLDGVRESYIGFLNSRSWRFSVLLYQS